MNRFELLPEGAIPGNPQDLTLTWPASPGASDSIRSSVDPWLTQFGGVSAAAIDLARIATGAYLADRLSPRRSGFSRTISLQTGLVDVAAWSGCIEELCDLLHWLTGDSWEIEISADGVPRPDAPAPLLDAEPTCIALFSGGLDSFSGSVVAGNAARILFGHWDNPIVKAAQDRSYSWLREHVDPVPQYWQVHLTQITPKREASSRSRSLLYLALAVAAADGTGTPVVTVPENGFTSINPPLGIERGGALSTRSTHPSTMDRINRLLARLGIQVHVANPHEALTKGELVAAAQASAPSFEEGAAVTLSCGKLDGRVYKGGNPNHHCGLCVPCLVRRASFIAGGVNDTTPYLCNTLAGTALDQLLSRRADDVTALRRSLSQGFDDTTLMALGPFPIGFDLDAAFDLCIRGFQELRHVQLPG